MPLAKILTVIVGIQIFKSFFLSFFPTSVHVVKVKLSDISMCLAINLKGKGLINLIIHTQRNITVSSLECQSVIIRGIKLIGHELHQTRVVSVYTCLNRTLIRLSLSRFF